MGEEELAARAAAQDQGSPGAAAGLHEQHRGNDAADGATGLRRLAADLFGSLLDAGMAMLDAHRQLAAAQTAEIADAVQRLGRGVDQAQSRPIDRCCDRAADAINAAAQRMRERRWGEIAADAWECAQRRPALFVVAALGTGFVAGRLLAAAGRARSRTVDGAA